MGEGTPGPRGHRSSWTTDGCHGQVIVTMGRTWVLPHVTSAWLLRANTGLLASLCAPPPIAHYLQPMSMAGTEEEDPTVMSQHYFATQEL